MKRTGTALIGVLTVSASAALARAEPATAPTAPKSPDEWVRRWPDGRFRERWERWLDRRGAWRQPWGLPDRWRAPAPRLPRVAPPIPPPPAPFAIDPMPGWVPPPGSRAFRFNGTEYYIVPLTRPVR